MAVACSNNSGKQASSGSSSASNGASATKDANGDAQQIRDLYENGNAAVEDFDAATILDLTCAKYRPKMQENLDKTIPPMSNFGSPEELKDAGVDKIRDAFTEKFKPASDEAIGKLAQALVDNDQAGYRAAMEEILKEGISNKLDKIENIVVKGDTATADTTTTEVIFSAAPKTETKNSQAVREDGKWKDCTPPGGRLSTGQSRRRTARRRSMNPDDGATDQPATTAPHRPTRPVRGVSVRAVLPGGCGARRRRRGCSTRRRQHWTPGAADVHRRIRSSRRDLRPGPILAATSGILFGPVLGIFVTLGATVGTATITSLVGRRAGRKARGHSSGLSAPTVSTNSSRGGDCGPSSRNGSFPVCRMRWPPTLSALSEFRCGKWPLARSLARYPGPSSTPR